jgi:hypothetical protein
MSSSTSIWFATKSTTPWRPRQTPSVNASEGALEDQVRLGVRLDEAAPVIHVARPGGLVERRNA